MSEYHLDRPGTTEAARELRAELVGRARDLVPLLAKNAPQTEKDRRIVEENITAIREAGLFKLTLPKRFGGYETDVRTLVEVTRELGRGCGSTAWITAIMNGGTTFVAQYNDRTQQEVWGDDPDAMIASSFNPFGDAVKVDGGYMVSGRWGWASGCYHVQWGAIGVPLTRDENGEVDEVGLCLMPMSELTIEDTWYVAGMRGTGSNTLVGKDIFVPDHRIVYPAKQLKGEFDTEHKDEVLYRSPLVGFAILSIMGPQLGLAVGAMEFVLDKAPNRSISYSHYKTQVEAPTVQLAVAEAQMHIDAAHLLAYRAAADTDQAGIDGIFLGHNERARIHANVAAAVVHAREAIRILVSAHGTSSFAESNPLQRIWRDSEVASRHAIINPAIANEVYGRSLLGIEEGVTSFV